MATNKENFRCALQICKLGGLFLLPFLFSFFSLDKLDERQSICLFKNIFGIDCYGCGITKAIISAVQLDFVRAFSYNKLIIVVMPLIIYLWVKEIIQRAKVLKNCSIWLKTPKI
jgi:hypothetical protein